MHCGCPHAARGGSTRGAPPSPKVVAHVNRTSSLRRRSMALRRPSKRRKLKGPVAIAGAVMASAASTLYHASCIARKAPKSNTRQLTFEAGHNLQDVVFSTVCLAARKLPNCHDLFLTGSRTGSSTRRGLEQVRSRMKHLLPTTF